MVYWKTKSGEVLKCKIVAVFTIDDAINKSAIGQKVYRIESEGHDVHGLRDDLQEV